MPCAQRRTSLAAIGSFSWPPPSGTPIQRSTSLVSKSGKRRRTSSAFTRDLQRLAYLTERQILARSAPVRFNARMAGAVLAFSHTGVCVADLPRAVRFYCDGLGFREVAALDLA